ncbi:MAG TPA: ABC transporter permease [Pseudonocardiaceae bacterium]|jgi:ABC-type nitrate/sulfonate/bicarbonate transport system permease component|nr:ABC transporter permease [Pseudonocardiaceae bacterium]
MTATQEAAVGRPGPRTAPSAGMPSGHSGLSGWARRHSSLLLGTLGVLVVLVAWQICASTGVVDISFTSSPFRIAQEEGTLFHSGQIYPALGATGLELLWGLLISFIAGIPIGLVLGRSKILHDMTEPIVNVLYSVPYVIFMPIIIFWFGINETSRVVVIIWAAILPLVINVTAGVRALNNDYVRVATAFCASRTAFFRTVALPATMPYILAGIRLSVGKALVGAIVAELFLASQGLGYFVQNQTSNFDMDAAFAGIVLLAAAALILNWGVGLIERRFTHWAGAQ